MVTEMT